MPEGSTLLAPRHSAVAPYMSRASTAEAHRRPSGDDNQERASVEAELMRQGLRCYAFAEHHADDDGSGIHVCQALDSPLLSGDTLDLPVCLEGPSKGVCSYVECHPVDFYLQLSFFWINDQAWSPLHQHGPLSQKLLFGEGGVQLEQPDVPHLKRAKSCYVFPNSHLVQRPYEVFSKAWSPLHQHGPLSQKLLFGGGSVQLQQPDVPHFKRTKSCYVFLNSHLVQRPYEVFSMDSWHFSLKYKCKYERAKFENDGEVASNKQKFGKKPSSQDAANGSESAKRVCRQPEKLGTPSEDEHSIQGHIRSMQKEMSKALPNMEKVQDGMSRTFSARRQWIATEHPSVEEILSRYPALEGAEEIFRELERFGGDPPVQTIIAVAEEQINTLLNVAAKKADKTTFEMLEKAEACDTEDQKLMTALAFLLLLPPTVRERPDAFLKDTAPTFSKYPCVVWDGALESPGPCMEQVESQLFKVDHPVHAILVAFSLHWVVDMCYQPAARGHYTLVEHLLGLTATKPAGMVLTTLSAIKEALKKK
ncbi:uncharacterized protein ISCGN_002798 [Ixodes scapularis]